jgi:hypothetical protein
MTGETTGGCLCGSIRYAFDGPPDWVVHCHCATCRKHVSSPLATFVSVGRGRFRFIRGQPRVYRSSPGVRRSFCGECGSPIAYEADRVPDEIHLYHGTLDDPGALVPEAHVHTGERLPWFEVHDVLPRYQAGGRGGVAPVGHGPRREAPSAGSR